MCIFFDNWRRWIGALVALSTITSSALTATPVYAANPSENGKLMDPQPAIVELSKANRFTNRLAGEGSTNTTFATYDRLSKKATELTTRDLLWLKGHGTATGRVYASFLFFAKDKKEGAHSFLELLDDDTPLEYQSGCERSTESVSKVGRSVVATGSFEDFESKVLQDGKPIYVNQLKTAEKFADEIGAESGRFLETLVFGAALENVRTLKMEDLAEIKAKGTPAGRLYAAVLMISSGKTSKDAAYKGLLNDQSKVTYASGCKMCEVKVAEVAKQLMTTGKFHNFKVKAKS